MFWSAIGSLGTPPVKAELVEPPNVSVSQWVDLKNWVEGELKKNSGYDYRDPYSMYKSLTYREALNKMKELESDYACKSLKEAGY